ncbi:MAG TPA: pitrilysin family protein [Rhodanobacteraceae bacterium]
MKYHGKVTPLALAVALGIGLVVGGVQPVWAAAPASATQTQHGNVLRATLHNGLEVVIVADKLSPTVTTQITYKTGGYEAPKGFPGTAHALEHMMFRNIKGLTGAQLNELTGKMGAENNAFTTEDGTQYFFVAPAQYADLLLKIESLRMRGALLTKKDWSLEKGAIEQEVSRDISSPDELAYQQAQKIVFAGTGYAAGALGTRPSFDKTTHAILEGFYNKWYQPNNALLVVAGDVDPEATLTKIKQLFGDIPRAELPTRKPAVFKPFKSQTIAKTTPDATGSVEFIYRFPGQRSQDYAALQVLMDVLNNARSQLSDLAAQGKVLSADAGAQSFAHGGMGIIEVGFPKGGSAKTAQVHLQAVVDNLLKHGVSADLVAAAKRQAASDYEFSKNSLTGLAQSWSQAIAWQGVDSPKDAQTLIQAITPAEVDRVARKYLTHDQRVTIVLTPSANGKRPPHSQGFGGTEKFGSNDKLTAPLPTWASKALAKLSMPHWTLDPVTMHLPNGIKLIVQPESISKTVTVVGRIDQNAKLQQPKGQEGVSSLLDMLFDYGTHKLDRQAFHKALDGIAASESGGSSFSLAVPSNHFDRGMQLLAANELHPALPQKAFGIQQKTLARSLAGMLQSPGYKTMRALYKGLYSAGDPALRQATPATVGRLDLAEVKNYYRQTYRPDMTTIVIVGDVTPAKAKAEVEKYFGAWKAVGPKPNVLLKPVPANKAHYTVVPNSYASQDQVLMAQTLALNVHNPERYALQLGNDVLGGNGFASRLMVDIRVKHGYAYGAGSGMSFGRSRSLFYVQYASDPSKVAPVDVLVRKNLHAMLDTPVNPDELRNAKQAEIRSIPLRVSSVGSIASSLLGWSIDGLPLNEPMVAARHYLDMTAAQVQAAFRKYVKPAQLVQVVQGPVPKKH